MNRHIIAITAGLFLMPSVAFTQNGYLGIGAGPANYSEASFDESDTGFTLYGGIRIHENFALELSYTDFGKQEGDYNSLNASVEVTGLGFSALGILPINDKFDIIGKIGFISWPEFNSLVQPMDLFLRITDSGFCNQGICAVGY